VFLITIIKTGIVHIFIKIVSFCWVLVEVIYIGLLKKFILQVGDVRTDVASTTVSTVLLVSDSFMESSYDILIFWVVGDEPDHKTFKISDIPKFFFILY
jgi:hypothetical protein